MAATLLSLILALAIYLGGFLPPMIAQTPEALSVLGIGAALAWILVIPILIGLPAIALQRAEATTPQVLALLRSERHWRWNLIVWVTLPLLSLTLIIVPYNPFLVCFWVVLLGISLDLIRQYVRCVVELLHPPTAFQHMTLAAQNSVTNENEEGLFTWLDAVSDASARAARKVSPSVARAGLHSILCMTESYISELAHRERRLVGESEDSSDQLRIALYFIFERLRLIYTQAMRRHCLPIANEVINTTSQITLLVGKTNFPCSTVTLSEFGDYARSAFIRGQQEQVIKVRCALMVIARALLEEENVQHSDIKEFYINLIAHLETIAQECFRQDKDTDITLLTQPFRDLERLFGQKKWDGRGDVGIIRNSLQRVLEDFSALEAVMAQMEITGEEDSSEDTDLSPVDEKTEPSEEERLAKMAGLSDVEGLQDIEEIKKRIQETLSADLEDSEEGEPEEKE